MNLPENTAPFSIAYDSGEGLLFVADWNPSTVSVVSDVTNSLVATIPVGPIPEGCVAYDSGKGEILVTDPVTDALLVLSDQNINEAKVSTVPSAPSPSASPTPVLQGETPHSLGTPATPAPTPPTLTVDPIATPAPSPTPTSPALNPAISLGNVGQSNLLEIIYGIITGLATATIIIGALMYVTKERRTSLQEKSASK